MKRGGFFAALGAVAVVPILPKLPVPSVPAPVVTASTGTFVTSYVYANPLPWRYYKDSLVLSVTDLADD